MDIETALPFLESVTKKKGNFTNGVTDTALRYLTEIALNILSRNVALTPVEQKFWAKFQADLKVLASSRSAGIVALTASV